ncbi:PHP domain-containing protein [Anaerosporobacter sp.]|uniref:PHP domain-containing protein n=1 Tax=Anaerosporobacter sp. TaxID=1872529 RepID=UPI00286EEE9A|nr:PHP domain-containing protein [Anaerosporobacter sp.]
MNTLKNTDNRLADLHIHSFYSDGTMSPMEILRESMAKGVGCVAITDHNEIKGSIEMQELCNGTSMINIPGVELDIIEDGINFHILGFDLDFTNTEFLKLLERNKELLEDVNIKLIQKMEQNSEDVSLKEYNQFNYERSKGGWKALHYFMYKGLTSTLQEGFNIYQNYNHSYTCVDFPTLSEITKVIHLAGGKAVLAHPGRVIKYKDLVEFELEIRLLLTKELDGIECYYPSHSKEVTDICLKICKEKNLIITGGSDCHGEFEDTTIGENKIQIRDLVIMRK